ncbi:dipeptide epimerase [Anoxynatronum buryatiense]|uniref:Dipeptide epimerase n=1 Tax=Anoxynatronum buryatiense TaxID=489973 RepID=A0AA45WVN3_9CLOT|nr:dipeptide epimerase [Anoxynatronum buryatiense]SMP54728.1 L-alanine-DL-glutamate epimerase [Anoxynatronum buryatiense]
MKITDIQVKRLRIPLKKPFKTALRTVEAVEDILITIHTDTGDIGYGEAPPTAVITGDTREGIEGAILGHIKPRLLGLPVVELETIMERLHTALVGNTSAKAAVDMALYDLFARYHQAPLFRLLGGARQTLATDLTISVNDSAEMAEDARQAVLLGYSTLKIKVGKDPQQDLKRIKALRQTLGDGVTLRLDANQGWTPREAVKLIRQMEEADLGIELVEQPVKAGDLEGLKYVTQQVETLILADESVFSPLDALRIMQERAADLINIKLMKTGGIHQALKICALAEIYGMECMMGCMLESRLSVAAAAHVAAGRNIITRCDLDGPGLCADDPWQGGPVFDHAAITMSKEAGLGIVPGPTFDQYISQPFSSFSATPQKKM